MTITFRLPDYWQPERVDFFYDIINQLHDAIWNQYGDVLLDFWEKQDPSESLFVDDEDSDNQTVEPSGSDCANDHC